MFEIFEKVSDDYIKFYLWNSKEPIEKICNFDDASPISYKYFRINEKDFFNLIKSVYALFRNEKITFGKLPEMDVEFFKNFYFEDREIFSDGDFFEQLEKNFYFFKIRSELKNIIKELDKFAFKS